MVGSDKGHSAIGGWLQRFRWVKTSRDESVLAESRLLALSGVQLRQKDTPIHDGTNFIHSVEGGTPGAPALVYLPGYGAGIGFIFRVLKGLTQFSELFAVDLLGTGLSSRPKFTAKSTEEAESFFVDSLEEWRRVRQLESFILVGHSMGGYLAACYAMQHPERVQHLIMVCPAGVGQKPEDWSPPEAVKSPWTLRGQLYRLAVRLWKNGATPGGLIRMLGPYGPNLVQSYTKRRFLVGHHLTEEEVELFSEYMYSILSQEGSGEYALRHLLEPFAWPKKPLEHRMCHLMMPVSFVYGNQDWMDPKAAARVVERMKTNRSEVGQGDLRIFTTPNAGHYPFLDQPGIFLKDLLRICGSYCQSEDILRLVHDIADEYPLASGPAMDTRKDLEEEMESAAGPASAAVHIASDL